MAHLTDQQATLSAAPRSSHIFLEGPAGSGKTTTGVARLQYLLENGIPANTILVLVPQRTLSFPYLEAIRQPALPPGSKVDILTIGGLAQQIITLFWPITALPAGFRHPQKPPIFLTLETAQYYMASLIKPLLEQGYFESVKIHRNRLISQIIDNLNKASAVGIPYDQIGQRLKSAWIGDPAQKTIYDQAQECAIAFRHHCLENNLLDFSLKLEVFTKHLWKSFLVRKYLTQRYRHLIYDNTEEDIPIAHDILREWLPEFETALLIYDSGGGYRSFLGADPLSADSLREICDESVLFSGSHVMPKALSEFKLSLANTIQSRKALSLSSKALSSFTIEHHRFYPEMELWVCSTVADLVRTQNVSPGEIVILSPFLSDSLRFSLMNRLNDQGIPSWSHRPSRSLRDEPATSCLITLAKLAHPQWKMPLSRFDLRCALMQSIADLDLIRADLLAKITYKETKPEEGLSSFDRIQPAMQERITYWVGERFEQLRSWLEKYQRDTEIELDIFFSRLFGEILSQPGFGFYNNLDAATVAAKLIESAKNFRRSIPKNRPPCGNIYVLMIEGGILAAQYLISWESAPHQAVFIAPAYTYLMTNRPVSYQFWLDIGNLGWWQRINQPLTQPYILSRRWNENAVWTDAHEFQANQESLARLVSGLLQRCKKHVFLCMTVINEQGSEERSPLLHALQRMLRYTYSLEKAKHDI